HTLRALLMFSSLNPPPPSSTLFPYTTLFRSAEMTVPTLFICGREDKVLTLEQAVRGYAMTPRARLYVIAECGLHPQLEHPNEFKDRKSTRLNSSHQIISYAVFCLKKKN